MATHADVQNRSDTFDQLMKRKKRDFDERRKQQQQQHEKEKVHQPVSSFLLSAFRSKQQSALYNSALAILHKSISFNLVLHFISHTKCIKKASILYFF